MKKQLNYRFLLIVILVLIGLGGDSYIERTFHAFAQTGTKVFVQTFDNKAIEEMQFPIINDVTVTDRDGVSKIVFLHKLTSRDKSRFNLDFSIGEKEGSLDCTVAGDSVSIERYTQIFYAVDDSPIQSLRVQDGKIKASDLPEQKWNALVAKSE
jgi:hypothetical protein